jgi:hypothetical protein
VSDDAKTYREKGKVAALKVAVRDELNMRLLNGETYEQVCLWLRDTGHGLFNVENISNWYNSGYQKWLKHRDQLAAIRERSAVALDMVKALKASDATGNPETSLQEANDLLLASQLNEALSDFDPGNLKALLADDPAKFFELANRITGQSAERTRARKLELEFAKYRDQVAEAKAQLAKATATARSGGLTPEALAEIERAAALL